jgi:hypothetical protein
LDDWFVGRHAVPDRGWQGRSMLTRRYVPGILVLVVVLFVSVALNAQDFASITGVVTDPTGAVIPDVSVTLQNPQTGVMSKGVTNASGSYTLNQIKPGPGYKIEFSKDGFKSAVVSGFT